MTKQQTKVDHVIIVNNALTVLKKSVFQHLKWKEQKNTVCHQKIQATIFVYNVTSWFLEIFIDHTEITNWPLFQWLLDVFNKHYRPGDWSSFEVINTEMIFRKTKRNGRREILSVFVDISMRSLDTLWFFAVLAVSRSKPSFLVIMMWSGYLRCRWSW